MHRAAVLGSPIAHSLSPALHRAAYAALGLSDWEYAAHEVREDGLAGFVAGLDQTWRGLSLTMPLKEVAATLATEVSATARRTGSVNTLVRRPDGGWDAHNTDVRGIVEALAGHVSGSPDAVLLGGGATARSALVALGELGVRSVSVAVRDPAKGQRLVDLAPEGLAVQVRPLADWPTLPGEVVVSTLAPAGGVAAADALAGSGVRRTGVLLDCVYAGWPTRLAQACAATGLVTVSGVEMLLHQAVEQVRLMTGQLPPVEAMRAALAPPA
ncbi:MAG: shikimate dehydrogenase [Micrococcales bacterium]|nr:shikimate dehydrogenase [Micrococcales bacterium]